MPKSKRNKIVPLTKVKRKGKEWKAGLVGQLRSWADEYPRVYLFRYANFRNGAFKRLRESLAASSRFFLGSNRVARVALGRGPADEAAPGLAALAARVRGPAGLMFTALPRAEAEAAARVFEARDFARAGSVAAADFVIPEGPVEVGGAPMAHTLEPALRQHGAPSRLARGVVEMVAEHAVCRAGERLRPAQAALLRMFGERTATFRLRLLGVWEGGAYEELDGGGGSSDDEGGGEDEDEEDEEDQGGGGAE